MRSSSPGCAAERGELQRPLAVGVADPDLGSPAALRREGETLAIGAELRCGVEVCRVDQRLRALGGVRQGIERDLPNGDIDVPLFEDEAVGVPGQHWLAHERVTTEQPRWLSTICGDFPQP